MKVVLPQLRELESGAASFQPLSKSADLAQHSEPAQIAATQDHTVTLRTSPVQPLLVRVCTATPQLRRHSITTDKISRPHVRSTALYPNSTHLDSSLSARSISIPLKVHMETASFVLAVFPLVVTAIEHWETFAGSAITLFRWKKKLQQSLSDLQYEQIRFRTNLRVLLQSIVDSQADLWEMLNNPTSELWKREIDVELSERLGKEESAEYKRNVQECSCVLEKLAEAFRAFRENIQWASSSVLVAQLFVLRLTQPTEGRTANTNGVFGNPRRTWENWQLQSRCQSPLQKEFSVRAYC